MFDVDGDDPQLELFFSLKTQSGSQSSNGWVFCRQHSVFGPAINLAFYPLLLAGELFQQYTAVTTWASVLTKPSTNVIQLQQRPL